MKKIQLLVISLFICFSVTLNAQDNSADYKPFSFGLKAVPSLSFFKVESSNFNNGSPSLNFGYGLIAEFNFAPNYGLLTGVEISDNGGKLDTDPQSKIYYYPVGDTIKFYLSSRKYSTKYLNIPLVLKLKTNEIGYLKYYGQFGVDAGFRLKSRAEYVGRSDNTGSTKTINDVNVDDEINLIRLGLNVGLGAEYNLTGSTSLVFGLNYNNGFTNMLKKESKTMFLEEGTNSSWLVQEAYNNYVTFTVGILF